MVGIETLSFYTPGYALDLRTLAKTRGVEPNKYLIGLGQKRMAVLPPDEDVVTMGANAAHQALADVDPTSIDSLMFATESGIDQSKAAAIYVHQLLDLPTSCKAFEIKQACCGSTAALQMALALVHQNPAKRVLIVASDVARYGLETPGEPTQGSGAIAMVISSTPKLLVLDAESGSYTEDVMDFWRPNYRDEALVDGKYSIKVYLKALGHSYHEYQRESGRSMADCYRFCFHLPFTRMAEKAMSHLDRVDNSGSQDGPRRFADTLHYNHVTGNSYTASLYIGLASLLEQTKETLAGQRIALFSYGSGCMATFFSGVVLEDYHRHLRQDQHTHMLESRTPLTYGEYHAFYSHALPEDGSVYETPRFSTGPFRLAGITNHKRRYERVSQPPLPLAAPSPDVAFV